MSFSRRKEILSSTIEMVNNIAASFQKFCVLGCHFDFRPSILEFLSVQACIEFAWEFEKAAAKLSIQRYFSRVKTSKDNPEIERFNQTLEYEWLYNSSLSLDPEELNPELTEWLIEYNFNRPHQSLGYLAPIEYIEKEPAKVHSPVLPMWSTSTGY